MSKLSVSVVITVYNRTDELRRTLDSLAAQTLPTEQFEVIIADDGSAEDVQAVLKDYPALQLKYAFQPDEGFRVAAARNLGADQAEGEIIVYNDNGMILSTTALERHVAHHSATGETTVVLGNMFATGWGTDENKARELLENNSPDVAIAKMQEEGMTDGRGNYFTNFGREVDKWFIPWHGLWGGHFSVNAAFVKKHNIRWNESFTTWGGEDNEYGIQLCNAGARLIFCEDVEVVHFPTKNSQAITVADDDFIKRYAKTKEHILSLHPDNIGVIAWYELGGMANDLSSPERKEFFALKGWE